MVIKVNDGVCTSFWHKAWIDDTLFHVMMDTMGFDRIDTTDFDHERRFVAFVKERAKLYQIGTDTGVRRLQTKLKKFNIKDKSPPKSKRKDKMVLDGSRTTEYGQVGSQSAMHGDNRRLGYGGDSENKNEKAERKDSLPCKRPVIGGCLPCLSLARFVGLQLYIMMVLMLLVDDVILSNSNDSFASLEVGKQSKTKMDTEVDEPLPMPERKDKMVLDGSRTTEYGQVGSQSAMHGDNRRLGYGGDSENKNEKAERKDSLPCKRPVIGGCLPCLSLARFVGLQLYIMMVLMLLVDDVILSNSNDSFASLEVGKQSKTKMDTEVDEPLPMPERKDKMVLDGSRTTEYGQVGSQSAMHGDNRRLGYGGDSENKNEKAERKDSLPCKRPVIGGCLPCLSLARFVGLQLYIMMVLMLLVDDVILSNSNDSFASLEVGKQSKTKMDTEVDEPLPMPERKDKMVLDGSRTTDYASVLEPPSRNACILQESVVSIAIGMGSKSSLISFHGAWELLEIPWSMLLRTREADLQSEMMSSYIVIVGRQSAMHGDSRRLGYGGGTENKNDKAEITLEIRIHGLGISLVACAEELFTVNFVYSGRFYHFESAHVTEVEKQSKTKMNTEVDKPLPMPERKRGRTEVVVAAAGGGYDLGFGRKKGIVLELWTCGEKIKKERYVFQEVYLEVMGAKTRMRSTNKWLWQSLFMPSRETYRIYLDGTHEGGLPFTGNRYLESEAWLSYHTKFLEKVFGSRASEMIEPSFGVTGIFVSLLTEELKQLGGMDGVKIFAEKPYRYEYF
ncbi:hypothetical protein RHSIM_Rhsim07G0256000 [Rhododendron simsii]|uniref:Uncharacterized protein n=1 Tax=Rhododendron simsii TaxID=118357 RepID=A0A834GKQ2_RHOSS|nr:hypothetical protein RHSIM_Rhsim07G0256000 [Rhododendron simsii]